MDDIVVQKNIEASVATEVTTMPDVHTVTNAPQNGQVLYTCSITGCGRRGSAYEMFHIQPYGQPSVDQEGRVRNVVCEACGKDALKYGGDDIQVFKLHETMRILATNAKRRNQEEQRQKGVNAFIKSLKGECSGTVKSKREE